MITSPEESHTHCFHDVNPKSKDKSHKLPTKPVVCCLCMGNLESYLTHGNILGIVKK